MHEKQDRKSQAYSPNTKREHIKMLKNVNFHDKVCCSNEFHFHDPYIYTFAHLKRPL
jgi:hypothetical protein